MKTQQILPIAFLFSSLASALPASAAPANSCYGAVLGQRGEFVHEINPIKRSVLRIEPAKLKEAKDTRPYIPWKIHDALIKKAMQPLKTGEFGPRIISNELDEVPDIDKAITILHPTGEKKFLGLSGQQFFLVDSIDELARGGLRRPENVTLLNEHGKPYGKDIDPKTGKPIPYAKNSSTWDVGGVMAKDEDGNDVLKILAGAMANDRNGNPLLISEKNAAQSRRRVVFHKSAWVETPAGSGNFHLVAWAPMSPFFKTVPRNGQWSIFNPDGSAAFIHSYGGGPVTLANGDMYEMPEGGVLWRGDGVFENRRVLGAKPGEWKIVPYRSGMYSAVLDTTLKEVIEPPKIILDVFNEDGSVWADAERPGVGPLVEGGHLEPRVIEVPGGPSRAIRSKEDLEDIRRRGLKEVFVMVGSQGKYDRNYGSHQAVSEDGENFKMVVKEDGELYDITEHFRVLTYATGRPVVQHGESGQEYVFFHADERTEYTGNLGDLSRQIWAAPIQRISVNGVEVIEIIDNTGLLNELKKYKPRLLKEKMK